VPPGLSLQPAAGAAVLSNRPWGISTDLMENPWRAHKQICLASGSVPANWKNPKVGHAIGLATLRRDGFTSLDAHKQPGTVITRPLTMPGNSLFVNAEVAKEG